MKTHEIDFSPYLCRINLLLPKYEHLESICGAGIIHDIRLNISILRAWKANMEWYQTHSINYNIEFHLYNVGVNSAQSYSPTLDEIKEYLTNLLDKIESDLAKFVLERK